MNKNAGILVLWFILTSCSIPKSEALTKAPITITPTSFEFTAKTLHVGDGGLISGQPCASPCFFGIHIGRTRLEKVISILETNEISPCYYDNETRIECGEGVYYIIIGADPSTFIVDGIVYYPGISISVGDVIKKYGNPNWIYVEPDGIPGATTVTMFLLWDSIKMRVDLPEMPDIGEQIYVVENTTEARKITYLDETSYSNPATSGFPQVWKGYGEYKP
jgi:hypothetical protein